MVVAINRANLSVYFSAGTDATEGGGQDGTNHTALSFKYAAGPATIGFGQQEIQGGAEERVANIKVSMAGLTAGYGFCHNCRKCRHRHYFCWRDLRNGRHYACVENNTTETAAGGTTADITSLGVHYSLGGRHSVR